MNNIEKQAIIIGAGPAGIACAIQLKRFGIDCVVFEKNKIGGLVENANLIENYPGFPDGVTGIEYVELIKKQFERHEIKFIKDEIVEVKFDNGIYTIISAKSNVYKAEHLVMATGTVPKKINFHSTVSKKIFYEIKDMPESKNKVIAIIGAGDAAFDYAINLSKSNQIKLFNRSSKIKALPLLANRVNENKNIEYFKNMEVKEISFVQCQNGENSSFSQFFTFVRSWSQKFVFLRPLLDNNKLKLSFVDDFEVLVDYLIFAIGRVPNDKLLTEELKDRSNLYIIGDVKNGLLRQTTIAAADGLKAATDIYERIKANRT